jgi:long-subunit fatty acid transport protein
MVHRMMGGKIGTLGLLMGVVSQAVMAQSLGLPASDPVGIGRSGTGVAFGASLEAASLNPALLVTLREPRSAYFGLGLEMQTAKLTLESDQKGLASSDRNRLLPALGAAWRLTDAWALGLKFDQPYLRHREFPLESSVRFLGRSVDLGTRRLEFQGAWAIRPNWSLGLGAGITQVQYSSEVYVKQGGVEYPLRQEGKANALSYTLGSRWAINSRWTLGGTYQGAIKASPTWAASTTGDIAQNVQPGSGQVVLPARAALGVRRRVNQFFTWEVDLRYIQGSGLKLPAQPSLSSVSAPVLNDSYRNGYGFSILGEFAWGRRWTARTGLEILPALVEQTVANPVIGGSKSAGISFGAGYKALGGELSFGYQFRQSLGQESTRIDGVWDESGYRATGVSLLSEASGHLFAIGYKRTF